MIGYLSGPITGNKNYKRQFSTAARRLRWLGYEVINPAALCEAIPVDSMSYEDIMDFDLTLLSKADYLVQLPGWEKSRGANRELGYAYAKDMIVVSLEALLREGRDQADGIAGNL